ncbi:GNAT family N-acetyltransferase [Oribacterium sp. C9]|uniref:GNAT family N-acetyltransferase n=1 Tax=Oribacterium sp. C9 TaxID=1943579 RepID=UPI0009CA88E1|nr:N-acetyltransferase [Oribacterium sp. C9]OON88037.1 GNAT family N-acetyltransferase [Oribacterium sp. C9]
MSIEIRIEEERDYRNVENLIRESFWNVYRPGCMEHYVVHCFRNDPAYIKELGFVMEEDGVLIGQAMYCRSEIKLDSGETLPAITLGPICIANDKKRTGYGKILLDATIEKAKSLGFGAIINEGNIDFYGKSGFVQAKSKGILYADDPEADYLLVLELKKGYLDGVHGTWADPEGYFCCEKDPEGFASYEASFPYKEKLKLTGQLF